MRRFIDKSSLPHRKPARNPSRSTNLTTSRNSLPPPSHAGHGVTGKPATPPPPSIPDRIDSSDHGGTTSTSHNIQATTLPQSRNSDPSHAALTVRCKIVVGIDFGTTFSGVAYAVIQPGETAEDVRVHTVSNWEGRLPGRSTSHKVPTEIAFDEDGDTHYWGFDIPDRLSTKKIKYVKLLMEPNVSRRVSHLSDHVNSEGTQDILKSMGRSAIQVAGLFVKSLWTHAKQQIVQQVGQATWNRAEIVVLFTVPAVWSERAKHNTYMIAVDAGLADDDISLHMISEPEAAAVAVLTDRARATTLSKDDVYVIVDAGGGTVDLTSYRVKTVEPLQLDEVVAGDGEVCGATFLGMNFQALLRTRIGLGQFRSLRPLNRERMFCDWENSIRSIFTGEDDREYVLVTPGVKDNMQNGIEGGMMTLDAQSLVPVFSPIVQRVEELIDKQLEYLRAEKFRPTAIVLVGGLGSNKYLAKPLKQMCQQMASTLETLVEIQQPDIAWESVALGAVRCEILGYGSIVSLRVSRYNIGSTMTLPWQDDGSFRPEQKVVDEFDGQTVAVGCADWYLRRGQQIKRDVPFEIFREVRFQDSEY